MDWFAEALENKEKRAKRKGSTVNINQSLLSPNLLVIFNALVFEGLKKGEVVFCLAFGLRSFSHHQHGEYGDAYDYDDYYRRYS